MTARRALAALVLLGCAGGVSACETTQDKAEALKAEGEALVASQVGVAVDKPNPDVKVLDTFVLRDEYGEAVVVTLRNEGKQPQVDIPIVFDVLDSKGKKVFSNGVPGLDESLTHVPFIAPGETAYWVNDQILATGVPKSANVKVGTSDAVASGPVPRLEVSEPRVNNDPSGIEVEGQVANPSQVDQQKLTIYAVATRGDEVVAAGRGQLKKLEGGGKPLAYNIFFIGDPRGAQIDVTAPPSTLE